MARPYLYTSLLFLILTVLWLGYEFNLRHFVRWHFMVSGAIHFLLAVIINRQYTKKNVNYLGWIHVVAAVVFFGLGYFDI